MVGPNDVMSLEPDGPSDMPVTLLLVPSLEYMCTSTLGEPPLYPCGCAESLILMSFESNDTMSLPNVRFLTMSRVEPPMEENAQMELPDPVQLLKLLFGAKSRKMPMLLPDVVLLVTLTEF